MIAEIIKIEPLTKSKNSKIKFIRVHLKAVKTGKWYKTDLVPTFRNFNRWRPYLRVGNIIEGLRAKDDKTIDADSWPVLKTDMRLTKKEEVLKELFRQGIFG